MTVGETPNLVLKKMLGLFLKIPPLKKILKFLRLKEVCSTYTEKKIQTRIKPMTENLKMNFIN